MNNSIQLSTARTAGEIFIAAKKIFGSTFNYIIENNNYMIFKNSIGHPIFTLFIEDSIVTIVDVNPMMREGGETLDFQNQIKKLV